MASRLKRRVPRVSKKLHSEQRYAVNKVRYNHGDDAAIEKLIEFYPGTTVTTATAILNRTVSWPQNGCF